MRRHDDRRERRHHLAGGIGYLYLYRYDLGLQGHSNNDWVSGCWGEITER